LRNARKNKAAKRTDGAAPPLALVKGGAPPVPHDVRQSLPRDVRQSLPRDVRQSLPSDVQDDREIVLDDGAKVRVVGGAVAEVRDAQDRLLVRYENGRAEVSVPAGDLVLSAPAGRVVLQAGTDVHVEASRDLVQRAGGRAAVEAPRLDVKADDTRVQAGNASVVAERISTTARAVVQQVERLEVSASRLFEKTRETYREAADLLQTRAGRVRAIVQDACSLHAGRTTIVSKQETSIDGKKVLLG
jgi:hypothetical protein